MSTRARSGRAPAPQTTHAPQQEPAQAPVGQTAPAARAVAALERVLAADEVRLLDGRIAHVLTTTALHGHRVDQLCQQAGFDRYGFNSATHARFQALLAVDRINGVAQPWPRARAKDMEAVLRRYHSAEIEAIAERYCALNQVLTTHRAAGAARGEH